MTSFAISAAFSRATTGFRIAYNPGDNQYDLIQNTRDGHVIVSTGPRDYIREEYRCATAIRENIHLLGS
jgi:hypothetical protein